MFLSRYSRLLQTLASGACQKLASWERWAPVSLSVNENVDGTRAEYAVQGWYLFTEQRH